jgi:hypothetical protein
VKYLFPDARFGEPFISEDNMSNGELHAREREDLALHVERCAERYTAVRAEICGLRKQTRRIEGAIWGIVAVDLSRIYAALITHLGCLAFESQGAFASQR